MPDRRIMSGHISTGIPLGGNNAVRGKVLLFDSWCKKCGICSHFCPTGALEVNEEGYPILAHPDKCTLCGMCWVRCPDFAIIKDVANGKADKFKRTVKPNAPVQKKENSEGGDK